MFCHRLDHYRVLHGFHKNIGTYLHGNFSGHFWFRHIFTASTGSVKNDGDFTVVKTNFGQYF